MWTAHEAPYQAWTKRHVSQFITYPSREETLRNKYLAVPPPQLRRGCFHQIVFFPNKSSMVLLLLVIFMMMQMLS
ncbi:hypothetical protein M431DRAFT_523538 [Trichoderma harzianum CBS 226.95]|uniref:Uncharacterized protein n=1 Tax=Trichoderma harzianum CBS 226.95 TaxID=983964 RepID=A0A2T4A1B9_TRIHA|nr:hypothetical protein M431DRAFT_523538 [Trichoderma harzianum CBS 226.95]PTB50849.1 hypothetical protein M431DRAFT_523538 [Trichoderma harzianum CBS 226.95]